MNNKPNLTEISDQLTDAELGIMVLDGRALRLEKMLQESIAKARGLVRDD